MNTTRVTIKPGHIHRIEKLSGSQARIALFKVAAGKSMREALDIAETYAPTTSTPVAAEEPPCGASLVTCDTCDHHDDCAPCDVCGTRHSKANLHLSFHYYCKVCSGR